MAPYDQFHYKTSSVKNQSFKDLLAQVESYLERDIYPLEAKFLSKGFKAIEEDLQRHRAHIKELGWWTPQMPRELGGMGLNLLEFAYLSETLGKSLLGHYLFNCQAPDVGNLEVLHKFGTNEQKELFFKPLLEGKVRSCFAMTEPDFAGSNPTKLGTRAVLEGEQWVINGRKWFTSGADGAAFVIVVAVTEPGSDGRHVQASQIIVPMDTAGLKLVRNIPVMGEAGSGYASHSELIFEDCHVPKDYVLGAKGAGFVIGMERLTMGRIHHCMRWIGICERALDLMCKRVIGRVVAEDKQLWTSDFVQGWIADSRIEINATRALVFSVAQKIDQEGIYTVQEDIAMIKVHTANVLGRVLDRAIQAHGALGMTDELPLAYWFRHERAARIYDGPDEVHKKAIARGVLRKYGAF